MARINRRELSRINCWRTQREDACAPHSTDYQTSGTLFTEGSRLDVVMWLKPLICQRRNRVVSVVATGTPRASRNFLLKAAPPGLEIPEGLAGGHCTSHWTLDVVIPADPEPDKPFRIGTRALHALLRMLVLLLQVFHPLRHQDVLSKDKLSRRKMLTLRQQKVSSRHRVGSLPHSRHSHEVG